MLWFPFGLCIRFVVLVVVVAVQTFLSCGDPRQFHKNANCALLIKHMVRLHHADTFVFIDGLVCAVDVDYSGSLVQSESESFERETIECAFSVFIKRNKCVEM